MIFCKVLITNGCGIVLEKQGPEVRTEASPRADRRTTNRQEADSDERASRVRPKGQAQDARGQLRPKDRAAHPRVTKRASVLDAESALQGEDRPKAIRINLLTPIILFEKVSMRV
jgi:hypothetical protein